MFFGARETESNKYRASPEAPGSTTVRANVGGRNTGPVGNGAEAGSTGPVDDQRIGSHGNI